MKKLYAELLLATSFWGFGFVTATWALESMGPAWMSVFRFVIAIIFLHLIFRPQNYTWKKMKAVFWPGFFLTVMIFFLTWGLKYTSPTKSGFITVFYVMFIPLLERILYRVHFRKILYLWVLLAIMGGALICESLLSGFNSGDFLTLICALAAAAQFIAISRKVSHVSSPVEFHIYQSLWVVILSLLIAIPTEGLSFLEQAWPQRTWWSLLQLGVFSSGIAFLIQVRAQQKISPTTAGLFILLESPWAMFFSILFMGETLTALQFLGAGLIMSAAIGETLTQSLVGQRPVG